MILSLVTPVRMLTHLPLVRIDAPRVEIGGGALVALPFADYDELVLGAFTDSRRDYESTAPVFFVSEHDTDAPGERARRALEPATSRTAPASATRSPSRRRARRSPTPRCRSA